MAKLYVDANPRMVAYVLEDGGSGFQDLAEGYTIMEAEYLAIMYGLNEYFLKWQKQLDARQYNGLTEQELTAVAEISRVSKSPLPPPVLVCSDNEVVVKQLSRQYHIGNDRLRKLAQQVWKQCQNVDVKFQWIPRRDNLAGKMLK